jgi:uncharacterized membrane protein
MPPAQPGWGGSPGPAGFDASAWGGPAAGQGGMGLPGGTPVRVGWRSNRYTVITLGICALYLALALLTHIVLIGILPIFMSSRAVRAKERLAPVAVVVAVLVIVVSIATAYA